MPAPTNEQRFGEHFAGDSEGFEQVTVTNAARALTVPDNARSAVVQVLGAAVRYRDDGRDPTASVGLRADVGDALNIHGKPTLDAARFIRAGGADATLEVLYYN